MSYSPILLPIAICFADSYITFISPIIGASTNNSILSLTTIDILIRKIRNCLSVKRYCRIDATNKMSMTKIASMIVTLVVLPPKIAYLSQMLPNNYKQKCEHRTDRNFIEER